MKNFAESRKPGVSFYCSRKKYIYYSIYCLSLSKDIKPLYCLCLVNFEAFLTCIFNINYKLTQPCYLYVLNRNKLPSFKSLSRFGNRSKVQQHNSGEYEGRVNLMVLFLIKESRTRMFEHVPFPERKPINSIVKNF